MGSNHIEKLIFMIKSVLKKLQMTVVLYSVKKSIVIRNYKG